MWSFTAQELFDLPVCVLHLQYIDKLMIKLMLFYKNRYIKHFIVMYLQPKSSEFWINGKISLVKRLKNVIFPT